MMGFGLKLAAVAFAGLAISLAAGLAVAQNNGERMAAPTKWIDAWAVSYLPTTVNGQVQSQQTFANQTLRLNVFSHLAGTQARVKFTNKFTDVPLVINAARVALRANGPAIDPATDRELTFNGAKTVTVAPGASVWSDGVALEVKQHADVSISVYIKDSYRPTGFHPTGLKTSYIVPGDQTASATLTATEPGATPAPAAAPAPAPAGPPGRGARGGRGAGGLRTTDMVFLVSDLQVMAPSSTKVIVAIGDSITDGAASQTEGNAAWPSVLSKRLPKMADGTPVSVINMGIGSNRFMSSEQAGPPGIKRFDEDVLARTNVSHLIIMEGINDISYENVKPEQLIEAYKTAIGKAKAKGIKVYGATLLPIQNSRKDTPENIATQQAVNKWIRESGAYDAVIDFEKVVQDPANPLRIRANLTGDYVHPNTAGYKLMGDSIDLKLFD